MDGDWEEVKKPVKKEKPQQQMQGAAAMQVGGKKGKVLVAGVIQRSGKYGGPGAVTSGAAAAGHEVQNHASLVADYDFGVDEDQEEVKFETYSHVCSQAVKSARTDASKTQAQLAKMVNEKTSTIVELENGTGRYSADLINRIERALGVKIDRGRKKKRR